MLKTPSYRLGSEDGRTEQILTLEGPLFDVLFLKEQVDALEIPDNREVGHQDATAETGGQ